MKFTPSRAHRWVGGGCTASVAAESAVPPRPSTGDSEEGVRLHELAATYLRGEGEIPAEDLPQLLAYVDDVCAVEMDNCIRVWAERQVTHPLLSNGYVDAYVLLTKKLIIWDYKSGRRPVEARENWQMICYAMALLKDHDGPLPEVELRVVQPNAWHPDGPVRSWVMPNPDVYFEVIRATADEARRAPKYTATPSNCTYCNAVTTCPAARDVTLGGADMAMVHPSGPLPPEAIRSELVTLRNTKKLITERLDALEAEAEARLQGGEHIPGCGMVHGKQSARYWTADKDKLRTIVAELGVKPTKETLLTPKQIIDAGVPAEVVDKLAKRGTSKPVLSTEIEREMEKLFND